MIMEGNRPIVTRGLAPISPGPKSILDKPPFSSPCGLRELHKLAFADYDRAYHKFGRPSFLISRLGNTGRHELTQLPSYDVVVQVLETPSEYLTFWNGDTLMPSWFIRIAADPNKRTRGLKGLLMRAPIYHLGRQGSDGPFVAMSPMMHQSFAN